VLQNKKYGKGNVGDNLVLKNNYISENTGKNIFDKCGSGFPPSP
jgi:hypothetical protein